MGQDRTSSLQESIRQIARETGHTRRTVRKVLAGQDPKYRREKEPACPVMDPVAGIVEGWLRADREQPVKQRHTAHRVWRRLVDEDGSGNGRCVWAGTEFEDLDQGSLSVWQSRSIGKGYDLRWDKLKSSVKGNAILKLRSFQ